MPDRRAFELPRRWTMHLLNASVFALLLLISDYSNAAIYVTQDSRVIVLSGYSSDLTKRELPAINERVGFLLQGLSEGLAAMFGANVEHLSEKGLATRLERRGLAKGEAAIKNFFRLEKYTHLLVADVQMSDEKHGSVSMQIFSLSPDDGSPVESDATRKTPLDAEQTDPELDELRQAILREFAQFRPPNAKKRVTVRCILPRNKIIFENEFTNPLKLERLLSEPVTVKIIEIHWSQKMQDLGYLPIVHTRSWEFEHVDDGKKITCKPAAPVGAVVNVPTKLPDYTIHGDVAVVDMATGFHKVVLKIQVVRELPTPCETPILIDHQFKQNSYEGNGKQILSSEFSEKILPAKYEQKWLASLGTCNK